MGKFNRYCYLCPNKGIKGCKISFHNFPSNVRMCLKWKMICNLRKEDNVTGLLICSQHFSPNDFSLSKRLKKTAIPSWPADTSVSGKTPKQVAADSITNESTIKEEPQCEDLCMLNNIDIPAPTSNKKCIQLNGNIAEEPAPTSNKECIELNRNIVLAPAPASSKTCIQLNGNIADVPAPTSNKKSIQVNRNILLLPAPASNKTCIQLNGNIADVPAPTSNKKCIQVNRNIVLLPAPASNKNSIQLSRNIVLVPAPTSDKTCIQPNGNIVDVPAPTSDITCVQFNGNIVNVSAPTSDNTSITSPEYIEHKTKEILERNALKKYFNLAEKQAKKIKTLQQRNRRLTKRVQSLKNVVKYYRKKDLLSAKTDCAVNETPDLIDEKKDKSKTKDIIKKIL